ncbi:uridine kinase [Bailinhaonella thermotolerans]|uniref:Uridine kinase n=1 Tax=Bailinhaonella thermotolerans TaxID=1070861 RepID=A0A3A4B7Z0_9ACTN|nr:uridine kinase [Bailinhaonella thermotolerans]RJL33604.1 uridine kinase [Bailinhaonella thermotolerans]
MTARRAEVRTSVSTWRQPRPAPASPERTRLIGELAGRILALGGERLRVGVDGPTAAGKTSFGHELAEHVAGAGRPVLRATLDDFKRPWRDRHLYDRESAEGYYRNAFDYEAVRALLLEPCGPGGSGRAALCAIDPLTQADHSAVVTTAEPDAVLIVDGVFAFRPEINEYWDFRVRLEVSPDTTLRRGAGRDRDWAGAEAEALHRDRYLPADRLYAAEVDPRGLADVVIDNTFFDRPRILPITPEPGPRGRTRSSG